MSDFFEILLHTDDALLDLVGRYGAATYLILFLIIYSETGLVIFPFLPGDGLLFSAGVIAAAGSLNIYALVLLLISAAILGNTTNYFFGKKLGKYMLKIQNKVFQHYLFQTQIFFQKHGAKAVVFSRFFPVMRTYVPFVSGISEMDFRIFSKYNIIGAVIWVNLFVVSGYLVGEIPWVKENYGLIFLGLIIITLIPFIYGGFKYFLSILFSNKKLNQNTNRPTR